MFRGPRGLLAGDRCAAPCGSSLGRNEEAHLVWTPPGALTRRTFEPQSTEQRFLRNAILTPRLAFEATLPWMIRYCASTADRGLLFIPTRKTTGALFANSGTDFEEIS